MGTTVFWRKLCDFWRKSNDFWGQSFFLVVLSGDEVEISGDFDDVDDVSCAELCHDVSSVIFDGSDGAVEFVGDLSVGSSGDEVFEDAFFGVGEGFSVEFVVSDFLVVGFVDGFLHDGEEGVLVEGLFEEVCGAGFDGLYGESDVAVACDEEDGQGGPVLVDVGEQGQAGHSGEFLVEDEEVAFLVFEGVEAVFGGVEGSDGEVVSIEDSGNGEADGWFVVDEEDHMARIIGHVFSLGLGTHVR